MNVTKASFHNIWTKTRHVIFDVRRKVFSRCGPRLYAIVPALIAGLHCNVNCMERIFQSCSTKEVWGIRDYIQISRHFGWLNLYSRTQTALNGSLRLYGDATSRRAHYTMIFAPQMLPLTDLKMLCPAISIQDSAVSLHIKKFYEKYLDRKHKSWYNKNVIKDICGCSSMVEFQPSKLAAWVRFPSPAPSVVSSPKYRVLSLLFFYLSRDGESSVLSFEPYKSLDIQFVYGAFVFDAHT